MDTTTAVRAPMPRTLDCRTVLVPLDGSAGAERALPTAGWLARRLDAELHVLAAEVGRSDAWWYDRYLDELRAAHPEVARAGGVPDSDVAHAVHQAARRVGPTVVCLATQGRGRTAALLGSTFSAVVSGHGEPLVAVGPLVRQAPTDTVGGRIVACVDGTPSSAGILPDAAAWARRLGMTLSIVTVAEPAPPAWVPRALRGRAFGPLDDPDDHLRELAGRPELAGLAVDTQVLWDAVGPDVGIFDHLARRPATLLAVGAHPRAGLARVALGSEAARIVHGSPVPVLVRPLARAA
jgi:nucleotide-binding universal stress UspA family protein